MQCCTARYALLDGVRGHRDILISCPRPAAHAAEQDLDSAQGCYEAEPDPIIPERNWVSEPDPFLNLTPSFLERPLRCVKQTPHP
jgi:hypothetical protein